MSLIRKSFSEPSVTTGDSRVTSIDLDWSTSAVLSRVQEASGPSQERITQVLLGPKYSAVV
jgi:hypothetical protein